MRCSECAADNRETARFCDSCGAALENAAGPTIEKSARPLSLIGERRHLTVLFCDLVGSTELAARLDPEEWRELMASYHRTATEAITRYGGYVAKYLGDGVMAYFGWPEAHENDAERAARAGLAILEALVKLNQQSTEPQISVRVGIDSGPVVVGAGAGKGTDVFGETPNTAARVQTAAAPNTVLITAATHRLLSGLFVVEQSGAQHLKGMAASVELYRVVRPTGVRSRMAVRDLTPFVGRDEELSFLTKKWERARQGEGQVVLVIGEAGIGKSRLVAEFHQCIRDTPHIWMESAGEQFFENTPFHAVSQMLSRWLDLQTLGEAQRSRAEESATCALQKGGHEEQFERLERALASAGLKVEEAAPLIGELLQLPVSERYPQSKLTPEEKRRRLLAALGAWTLGAARLQPVVMVVEDLHWLDPSTLDAQQLLAEQGATAPLMLLYTARPEFQPQWPMRSHHTQITLDRLSPHHAREIMARVAARNALGRESIEAVLERAGGVPLFVEELTKAVLESGSLKLSARAIPVTLHDTLMARLDRLGSAKSLLQLGAVIGGEFSYGLLRTLYPGSESELDSELRKLTDADLLYFSGLSPDTVFQFKHSLIRDTAYEALLKSRRKELHRLVAHTIAEKFPEIKQAQPEVLARHWTEAGELEPAVAEWSLAGKAMEARNAFHEAEDCYRQALSLLNLLPESPERDARELRFRQSLVAILHLTLGWTAPETVAATERLEVLARTSGNLKQLIGSMTTRCLHAYIGGELRVAGAIADQALGLAHIERNSTTLAYLHMLEVGTCYHSGNLSDAEKHLSRGVEFFDDRRFRQDPNGGPIAAYGAAALNAWVLGHPQIARARVSKLMAQVNSANPQEIAHSDWYAALLHMLMRDGPQAHRLATRGLELCEKHKFPNVAAYLRCVLGEIESSAELIRRGLAELHEMGSRIAITSCVTALAAAQYRTGELDDALKSIEDALDINPEELVYRPETLRLRGELRLAIGQTGEAEGDYRESIAVARSMDAKAWELRTTMSLARLLANDRRGEACTMLNEMCNWFTQGFDTADLKEAKVLLDELSSQHSSALATAASKRA